MVKEKIYYECFNNNDGTFISTGNQNTIKCIFDTIDVYKGKCEILQAINKLLEIKQFVQNYDGFDENIVLIWEYTGMFRASDKNICIGKITIKYI